MQTQCWNVGICAPGCLQQSVALTGAQRAGAASEAQETEKSAAATELSEAAKDEENNAKLRAAQRRVMSSTASVSMFQRATDRHAVEAEAPARDRLIDRLVLGAVADATLAAAE